MKISMVARADATGLGNQCQDWISNLPIEKVLVTWGGKEFNPNIYADKEVRVCEQGIPSLEDIDWVINGVDLVITIETPYNWNLISKARERSVKTIIAPNYEWFLLDPPEIPDLWFCYNSLNYEVLPEPKVYIPQPINRKVFPFKLREKAHTFLFNNGNGGANGRNNLDSFLSAIPFVKSDVKFIINSQIPIPVINDSRVQIQVGDLPLKEIWKEGDVFIHLRKFGANSLPINEAMSMGLPVIAVNRNPENKYLPPELLIDPEGITTYQCRKDVIKVDSCIISPLKIAEKIDEMANTDITKLSEMMNKNAEKLDWEVLRPKYIKLFGELCKSHLENPTSNNQK